MSIPEAVTAQLTNLGIELPEELLSRMSAYLDFILEANQRVNLTAVRDHDAAWQRLIIDSLTILPWLDDLEEDAKIIDVGSGGGLPGIPIAIARPDLAVTLLEATGKKAKILDACREALPLPNVSVLNTRAETGGQDADHRQKYEAAVCRAVGPMNELLEYTLPLVKTGGRVLAMKGPKAESELRDCGDALIQLGGGDVQVFDAYPEGSDINTVVVMVTKDRATPQMYPRLPGVPRQDPL